MAYHLSKNSLRCCRKHFLNSTRSGLQNVDMLFSRTLTPSTPGTPPNSVYGVYGHSQGFHSSSGQPKLLRKCHKTIKSPKLSLFSNESSPKLTSRCFTTTPSVYSLSPGGEWSLAMSEAERIVGYPTSFMSLRCLLSDEISNLAINMRKLVGSKHPIVDTARRFIYDNTHSLQVRGLLVLLVAKAAGPSKRNEDSDIIENMVSGIYPSQRSLAEIGEMIHTAYLIHKGVVNLEPDPTSDLCFGNKMSVLSGDFLLANASRALAQLYNTRVVDIMSHAIADMAQAEFTSLRDADGRHVLPQEGTNVSTWEKQSFLSSGSLLAHSCHAVMLLAQHSTRWQDLAFKFGRNVALADQLHQELSPLLQKAGSEKQPVTLTSLPIILHLQKHPDDLATIKSLVGKTAVNNHEVIEVLTSSGSIDESRDRMSTYREEALQSVKEFSQSDASLALENIVKAITSV